MEFRILTVTGKGVHGGIISTMCTISLNKTRDVLISVVCIWFGVGRRSVSEFGPGSFSPKRLQKETQKGRSRNYGNASEWIHWLQQGKSFRTGCSRGSDHKHNQLMTKNDSGQAKIGCSTSRGDFFLCVYVDVWRKHFPLQTRLHRSISSAEPRQNVLERDNLPPTCSHGLSLSALKRQPVP